MSVDTTRSGLIGPAPLTRAVPTLSRTPLLGAGVTISPGTTGTGTLRNNDLANYNWGSWVEIIAAAAADMEIIGIGGVGLSNAQEYGFEIGVGPAASEVSLGVWGYWVSTDAGNAERLVPLGGTVPVAAGQRVAVRTAVGDTSTRNIAVRLIHREPPS